MKQQIQTNKIEWKEVEIGELLDYEQPGKYIVDGEILKEKTKSSVPVLTANKSFILGYTEEKKGIYENPPVIIFDDFTTDTKFVDFKFKVKSSAMKLLKPKSKDVNLKFVFLMMKGIQLNFSTHKRYYLSVYQKRNILIPFSNNKPDLKEQERIVKILEESERLNERGKRAEELLDEFLKSIFYEMFLKDEEKFEIKKLSDVVLPEKNSLKRGPFGGSLKKEIFVSEGFKVYEQQNAIYDNCERGNYYITSNKFEEMKDFSVKPGDIIISCSGTIGKISILPKNCPKGIINQALLKISLDNKKILHLFFKFFFESPIIQDKLFGFSHGSGIKNFPPMSNIRNLEIPLPPLSLQQKFASIVEQIEKMKESVNKTKQNSKELFNSLVSKGFRGEL